MTWLIAIVIIVIVALAAGAVVWAGRKKRTAAPPTNDQRVATHQEAPIEYRPIPKAKVAPHAPPPRPPPVPPAAAAHTSATAPAPAATPYSPSASAVATEADAREAIDNLERIIQDAEAAGLDIAKARQTLKIARSFLDMEKYEKAMSYCKAAEDQVG